MPKFNVMVKWQKEKYTDVECDTDDSPMTFKAQLFALTGVPPSRQKVMMAGGILNDISFDGLRLKNGITIMMMGTTDEIPSTTSTSTPMEIDKLAAAEQLKLPFGLLNLGNTCYLNATLQLLYSVPELRTSLNLMGRGQNVDALVDVMRLLFSHMDNATKAVAPLNFLAAFHSAFPQFAIPASDKSQSGNDEGGISSMLGIFGGGGGYQQQDANECWTELVRVLQRPTAQTAVMALIPNLPKSLGSSGGWNPIDRFFAGQLECEMKCIEEDGKDEPSVSTVETFTQLSCFINKDIKYLHTGIRNSLLTTLSKHSSHLGRDATYNKVSNISRLPGYLSVQFVRFFYKDKAAINAKILKDVKFPLSLDLYEFCTKELQEKLFPTREKAGLEEERIAEESRARTVAGKPVEIPKKVDPWSKPEQYEPYWLEDDLGSNNTGYYDLQGVLTHQGRSSASGHYVAWVKHKNAWCKFDDDTVTEVSEEDILRLSGGGDWHCAYVLLYAPRRLEKRVEPPKDNSPVTGDNL